MKGKNMKSQKNGIKILAITILSVTILSATLFGLLAFFIYDDINFTADEKLFENSRYFESTLFYANNSENEDYQPVAIEMGGSMRKVHYTIDEIGKYITEGFVAVEDKKFYEHKGVDLKRTLMAAVNYITKKQKAFGASTITQQVIKNISGDNQLTIKRKLGEIIRALHIEREYSKKDILEVYLNVIPMGDNIFGIGAAAKLYFGKEPGDLSVSEAATLIGITNAPTAYSPYLHPQSLIKKRNIILKVMLDDGIIDKTEYENSVSQPLSVIPRENREDRFDSWFVETAIEDICADLSKKYDMSYSASRIMLLGGGFKVYTTMNPRIQKELENYFEDENNLATEVAVGLNYSMCVIDINTGDLAGIIGRAGRKQGNRLLNHAMVPHIPASTLKPIALYAPLIDEGKINWSTVFDDVPVSFVEAGDNLKEYPKNSPDVYDGLTTIKDGIRLSKNTIAVRLCKIRTPREIFNSLKNDFKFDSLIEKENNLTDIAIAPMALGQLGRGVSLLKLTEAYTTFPNDGVRREARSYLYVLDHNGRVVLENKKQENKVYKVSTARIMNRLLMNVTEDGTAKSISLKNKIDLAGKTGTSSGNKDKLFVGYTPRYTAGIWCGYDNGKSIESMSKSHLRIWDEVMSKIHIETVEREVFSTEGLLYLPYCMDSGQEFSEVCIYDPRGCRREYGYFTEDNRPDKICDRHVLCLYDAETKAISCEGCPSENLVAVSLINVNNRAFPKQITVTDAEFVYRDIGRFDDRPIDYALPYFEYAIPDGVFVGRSKGEKQFNSGCYIHK